MSTSEQPTTRRRRTVMIALSQAEDSLVSRQARVAVAPLMGRGINGAK